MIGALVTAILALFAALTPVFVEWLGKKIDETAPLPAPPLDPVEVVLKRHERETQELVEARSDPIAVAAVFAERDRMLSEAGVVPTTPAKTSGCGCGRGKCQGGI